MNDPPPSSETLAPLALERATVLAPFVFAAMLVALVLSEPLGVPLSTPVVVFNGFALGLLAFGSVVLRRRLVPVRWGHAVLAATWGIPVIGTIMSGSLTDLSRLMPVVLVEVVCAAILLRTRLVLAALALLDAVWIPLIVHADGDLGMLASSMLLAQIFCVLFQRLHRNALLRAEQHRSFQQRTARELESQLTELRRSEEARGALHEQLMHSQRLEATGTLAAGLAHDMNNILASITTFAELLRSDVVSAGAHDDIDRIVAQAGRGAELTRGLLAFGRRGQYRKKVIVADSVLREVVPILSRTLPKSIQVLLRARASDACIDADATQLHQVIVNLAVNAKDAMSGTGILELESSRVEVSGAAAATIGIAPGAYVKLRVSDDGIGMDDATRRRVFEPFYTTKPAGKGTGLGLSTVWGIVQNHGGAVEVSSQPGSGATFSLYLPTTSALPLVEPPPPPPVKTTTRATVLVVDDEEGVRTSTARLLKRKGHDVLTAANGEEALRVYAEHAAVIGLVILDMGMPVMGGSQCFRKLRAVSSVPVLISTGYAADEEAQALTAEGAALLEKPFAPKQLVELVARLLAQS